MSRKLSKKRSSGKLRVDDWETKLWLYVDSCISRPFKFGEYDCCIFCGDCIQLVTDDDPMEVFRGTYSGELQANLLINKLGGLDQACSDIFGDKIKASDIMRGDLVMTETGALGICVGKWVASPCKPAGISFLMRSSWSYGWAIGR